MTLLETRRLAACRRRAQYLQRLRRLLDVQAFQSVRCLAEPGVYVWKRRLRAAAGSQAAMLELAGTVFHHVVVYVKEGDKVCSLGRHSCERLEILVPAPCPGTCAAGALLWCALSLPGVPVPAALAGLQNCRLASL